MTEQEWMELHDGFEGCKVKLLQRYGSYGQIPAWSVGVLSRQSPPDPRKATLYRTSDEQGHGVVWFLCRGGWRWGSVPFEHLLKVEDGTPVTEFDW